MPEKKAKIKKIIKEKAMTVEKGGKEVFDWAGEILFIS